MVVAPRVCAVVRIVRRSQKRCQHRMPLPDMFIWSPRGAEETHGAKAGLFYHSLPSTWIPCLLVAPAPAKPCACRRELTRGVWGRTMNLEPVPDSLPPRGRFTHLPPAVPGPLVSFCASKKRGG